MEDSLALLIPISVLLVFVIGVFFWWALRSGQYDDLEGPAYQILFDDRDESVRAESTESVESAESAEEKDTGTAA